MPAADVRQCSRCWTVPRGQPRTGAKAAPEVLAVLPAILDRLDIARERLSCVPNFQVQYTVINGALGEFVVALHLARYRYASHANLLAILQRPTRR